MCSLLLYGCIVFFYSGTSYLSEAIDSLGSSPPPLPDHGVRFYVGLRNVSIPDYAMISSNDFREKDYGLYYHAVYSVPGENDGLNDGLWCQSTNNGSCIGTWIRPDGQTIGPYMSASDPLYTVHALGQIGLLRPHAINKDPYQGLYKCLIPDWKGAARELVVWAGDKEVFDMLADTTIEPVVTFHIPPQPMDMDPPKFILRFVVVQVPPTDVVCQVRNASLELAGLSRELNSTLYSDSLGKIPSINVNVTLTLREAGDYQCTVTVFRISQSNLTVHTNVITILVTGLPTGLTAVRTGHTRVELSWTAPASNTPPVAGYEVFYAVSGSNSTQSGGTTTSTNATLSTGFTMGTTYEFFVVAYSNTKNTLPSAHSENQTVEMGVPQVDGLLKYSASSHSINVSWPIPMFTPINYTLTSVCTLLCNGTVVTHSVSAPMATDSSAAVIGLLPGSVCNITLLSLYSMEYSSTLMTVAETLPEVPLSSPDGLSVLAVYSTSLTVLWNQLNCSQQNGPITGYIISYNSATEHTFGDSNTQHTLTNLAPNTVYSLRVAAVNDAGISDLSVPVSATTDALSTISSSSSMFTNIILMLEVAPESNVTIVSFEVRYRQSGGSDQFISLGNTTNTTLNVSDLKPGTTYSFQVREFTTTFLSSWSPEMELTTESISQPVAITITSISDGTVLALWAPVNQPFLSQYTVYLSNVNTGVNATFITTLPNQLITGLTHGHQYQVQVSATLAISGNDYEGSKSLPVLFNPLAFSTFVCSATTEYVFVQPSDKFGQSPGAILVPSTTTECMSQDFTSTSTACHCPAAALQETSSLTDAVHTINTVTLVANFTTFACLVCLFLSAMIFLLVVMKGQRGRVKSPVLNKSREAVFNSMGMTQSPAYATTTLNTTSDFCAVNEEDGLYEVPDRLTKTDMDGREIPTSHS